MDGGSSGLSTCVHHRCICVKNFQTNPSPSLFIYKTAASECGILSGTFLSRPKVDPREEQGPPCRVVAYLGNCRKPLWEPMGQHHRQVIPSTGARGRMNEFGATLCLLDLLLAPFLPRSKVEPRKVHVYPQTVTPKSGSYRVGRWWPRHTWLLATPTTPQKDATSGRATTTGAAMRLLGLALGSFFFSLCKMKEWCISPF